jgi:hypothetical protein
MKNSTIVNLLSQEYLIPIVVTFWFVLMERDFAVRAILLRRDEDPDLRLLMEVLDDRVGFVSFYYDL